MQSVTKFAPWSGLVGGLLIGLAAAFYLLALGRIAGISGLLEQALRPSRPGFGQALAFLIGLPLGALVAVIAGGGQVDPRVSLQGGALVIMVAGLLVGFGTRLANGCTSGHGVCGLPRFSKRSIVATSVFMLTAMATVFVVRHIA
jgi:uncharacterized membrane protein YedE/YeeE